MDAQFWQITGFLFVFGGMSLLMFFRKMPAMLALPLMALLVSALGGVSVRDILDHVVGAGATRLHEACTVAIFGGMLSFLLQKSGVAESLIKKGAELAGDQPWSVSVIMLILICLLFTTLGGLGAIIMIATVALPVLASVGVGPATTAGIFLIGLNLGGILNPGNWALYIDVLGLPRPEIQRFALFLFGLTTAMSLIFITRELRKEGHPIQGRRIAFGIALLGSVIAVGFLVRRFSEWPVISATLYLGSLACRYAAGLLAAFTALHILFDLARKITGRDRYMNLVRWYAFLTPIVPLVLIMGFSVSIVAAFVAGILYGFAVTLRRGSVNMLSQAIVEGGGSVIPAVVLMMGIGMLLNSIMGPGPQWQQTHGSPWPVLALLQPFVARIVPSSPVGYVILFTALAPLALYRGPLNVWGMGYGIAAVMMASGALPTAAIMGVLLSVGLIQGICDPTNTQNVWIANELKVDVQEILRRTLVYVWPASCLGLAISACLHF